ncbi:type II toxin-antitoxin system PemK/MazF family toxin [Pleomorphovibrio marinus]|uniref:type II toxin-antitoxin system PemK/MazF family toxin n=1 Tax=Pleomorphovibrio marinus TaxID=2164132 RepID=UPI0018E567CA|nr:type II toxin-antitoxin system PemK/MazF family toxin [Pleomorphovibrio marinus]
MKFTKWSIWRANLDPVIRSEQGKTRPVLIISEDDINELLNIVNIIPITSRKPDRTIYPNEVLLLAGKHGLENEPIALCHQIRTIDKKRLSTKSVTMTKPCSCLICLSSSDSDRYRSASVSSLKKASSSRIFLLLP